MMRAPLVILWLAVWLLGGCTVPVKQTGAADAPIETSIAAVRADPHAYDGKYVRVRGLIGQCAGGRSGCAIFAIAPDGKPQWEAPSLGLSFSRDTATLNFPEDMPVNDIEGALGYLYRFSEVTVEGRYEFSCDSADYNFDHKVKQGPLEEIVVCTDGAIDFGDVKIVAVHHRWPSTAFSRFRPDGKLTPLTAQDTRALITLYEGFNVPPSKRDGTPYLAFAGRDDDARLCVCLTKNCDGQWPTEAWQLLSSPMNPYACVRAERAHGAWQFPPSLGR